MMRYKNPRTDVINLKYLDLKHKHRILIHYFVIKMFFRKAFCILFKTFLLTYFLFAKLIVIFCLRTCNVTNITNQKLYESDVISTHCH